MSLIVREAEGSVRDGLSLLDQVFSYGESPITVDDVVEVLGLVNRDVLNNIARALLAGDRAGALANLSETFSYGMDTKRFMSDLLESFRALLLLKIDGCQHLLDLAENDKETLQKTADEFTIESIHQKLSLLMKTAEDLRYSSQPRLTLETAFLAIIESGNVTAVASLLSTLDKTLATLPEQDEKAPTPPSTIADEHPEQPKKKIAEKPVLPRDPEEPPPPESETTPIDDNQPPWQQDVPPTPEPDKTFQTAPVSPVPEQPAQDNEENRPVDDITARWQDFVDYIKDLKPGTGTGLQQATGIEVNDREIVINFENPEDYAILSAGRNRTSLEEFLQKFFKMRYTVSFRADETPETNNDTGANNPKKQRRKLASHPTVQMTEEILGGQAGTIRLYTK